MFLEVEDVWKKYPGTEALRGVTLGAERGTVLGVLGPNGAGKSTLFRIIATVTRPSKGRVVIDGIPAGLETRKITVIIETPLRYAEFVEHPFKIKGYGYPKGSIHIFRIVFGNGKHGWRREIKEYADIVLYIPQHTHRTVFPTHHFFTEILLGLGDFNYADVL